MLAKYYTGHLIVITRVQLFIIAATFKKDIIAGAHLYSITVHPQFYYQNNIVNQLSTTALLQAGPTSSSMLCESVIPRSIHLARSAMKTY